MRDLGFVPIQELEDAVEGSRKIHESFKRVVIKKDEDINSLYNKTQDLESRLTQERKLLEDTASEYQLTLTEKETHILNVERKNASLNTELELVKSFLKEEREENRSTREMIYLRTGMKRELFNSSESEVKEVKEELLKHQAASTRSGIRKQLEQRAARLLAEQRQKEDAAITKGELPKTEEVH